LEAQPETSTGDGARHRLRLARKEAFALKFLARELAGAAHGLGLFSGAPFGRLFVMAAKLHFAEDALSLHLLLESFEGLIDIVVADENLQANDPDLSKENNPSASTVELCVGHTRAGIGCPHAARQK
jgi:hypothetical protein